MIGEDLSYIFGEGMTMRYVMWTALAAGLMFVPTGESRANDVVRLGGPGVQTSADTGLVYHRGGFHHGGYYRGGHYGYRGYYGGYYGRGYYYRPYYYSYYRPYYYGGYGYGYGYGYPAYYPSYYYPSYYYPSYYYSYPCAVRPAPVVTAGPVVTPAPIVSQSTNIYTQPPSYALPNGTNPSVQLPPGPNGNGTYPYNGGPSNPVPLPQADNPLPMNGGPGGVIPLDGKLVSLPSETGVTLSQVATPDIQRLRYVSLPHSPIANTTPARITYPAYGEQPIAPLPRKTTNR